MRRTAPIRPAPPDAPPPARHDPSPRAPVLTVQFDPKWHVAAAVAAASVPAAGAAAVAAALALGRAIARKTVAHYANAIKFAVLLFRSVSYLIRCFLIASLCFKIPEVKSELLSLLLFICHSVFQNPRAEISELA